MRPRSSAGSGWTLLLVAALAALGASGTRSALSPATRLEAGRLLVARPGMLDPNFSETVVLLLSHGDEGAMGVIVNRPTGTPLSRVLPEAGWLAARPEVVFSGGPVAIDRLIFALRTETPPAGCHPVLPDVCASGSLELLEGALEAERPPSAFKGFAGYAGWAPGQLEWEIEQYGWYVLPGDSQSVFDSNPDEVWSDLIRVAESPVA